MVSPGLEMRSPGASGGADGVRMLDSSASAAAAEPHEVILGFVRRFPRTTFLFLGASLFCLISSIIAADKKQQICAGPPHNDLIPYEGCLTPHSYLVIWMTVCILLAMVNDVAPDIVLIFATVMLSILPMPCTDEYADEEGCTIITPEQAWNGFSSPPILAAATLLVFARCLEETRAVELMITPCLAGATSEASAVARLVYPTFFFSSFLNSTPIVAMLIPVCEAWCAKTGFKLTTVLMPLSFGAMLGGLTSLVGTASNMVLNALIEQDQYAPIRPFGFFSQAAAGVPAAIVGLAVLSFCAPIFLGKLGEPEDPIVVASGKEPSQMGTQNHLSGRVPSARRMSTGSANGSTRPMSATASDVHVQRGYEMRAVVGEGCSLVGKAVADVEQLEPEGVDASVAEAKHLSIYSMKSQDGAFVGPVRPVKVTAVVRADGARVDAMDAVALQAGDTLCLRIGAVLVPTLRAMPHLELGAEAASRALGSAKKPRALFEATLSKTSPLVGLTPTEAAEQPQLAHTALWGVRRGKHTDGGDGTADAPIKVGDTLLVEADSDFDEKRENDKEYVLLTLVPGSLVKSRSALAEIQLYSSLVCLVLMVVVSIENWMPILPLSFLLAFFLVAIGCITPEQAWASIKYRVILTIMAAFGLGAALENTNVSEIIAAALVATGRVSGAYLFLLLVFFLTATLSFMVGSTPAIILLYSAVRVSEVPNLLPAQSLMALMLGAVCALATPVGFATNLMVQARAGYKFADFALLGGVVTLAIGLVSCTIILVLPESMLPESTTNSTPNSQYYRANYANYVTHTSADYAQGVDVM